MLLQDPSYQFKDIKQLIMGMLETYSYEEVYQQRLKQAGKCGMKHRLFEAEYCSAYCLLRDI